MLKQAKKLGTKKMPKVQLVQSVIPASRLGTKSSIILKLLNHGEGATVASLSQATGWQEHSVRGFMSGTLKKKYGLDVASQLINGIRHYALRGGKPR